jgi:hypothetical protein
MTHETKITSGPIGKKLLKFQGQPTQGTITNITFSKDDNLLGEDIKGTCNGTDADLSVSQERFGDLSNLTGSFSFVIVTKKGVVVSCTTKPAKIAA